MEVYACWIYDKERKIIPRSKFGTEQMKRKLRKERCLPLVLPSPENVLRKADESPEALNHDFLQNNVGSLGMFIV